MVKKYISKLWYIVLYKAFMRSKFYKLVNISDSNGQYMSRDKLFFKDAIHTKVDLKNIDYVQRPLWIQYKNEFNQFFIIGTIESKNNNSVLISFYGDEKFFIELNKFINKLKRPSKKNKKKITIEQLSLQAIEFIAA